MKTRKIFAVLSSAALAAALAIPASASTPLAETTTGAPDYTWSWETLFDNTTGVDFSEGGATKIVINGTATDLNYGWNNGAFATNCNGGGWQSVTFGGENSDVSVKITEVGAFVVEVPFTPSDAWFEIKYGGVPANSFAVDSIDVYAGTTLLGTWEDGVYTEASTSGEGGQGTEGGEGGQGTEGGEGGQGTEGGEGGQGTEGGEGGQGTEGGEGGQGTEGGQAGEGTEGGNAEGGIDGGNTPSEGDGGTGTAPVDNGGTDATAPADGAGAPAGGGSDGSSGTGAAASSVAAVTVLGAAAAIISKKRK